MTVYAGNPHKTRLSQMLINTAYKGHGRRMSELLENLGHLQARTNTQFRELLTHVYYVTWVETRKTGGVRSSTRPLRSLTYER